MKKRRENNLGITLIALVITIILLLIIAGITIMTLRGENGLITRAIQAQTEAEKKQRLEELQLKIYDLQMKIYEEQGRDATLEDFYNLILEDIELDFIKATYKVASTEVENGEYETISVLYKNYIFIVDSELVIIDIEINNSIANVELTYEVKSVEEQDEKTIYTILLKFESQQEIKEIYYGEQKISSYAGKQTIAIDYSIEKGKESVFKIILKNGKQVEKKLVINRVIATKLIAPEILYVEQGTNRQIQIDNEPFFAELGKFTYISSDENIVTVDADGIITGVSLGIADITIKEEFSLLEINCKVQVMEGIDLNPYITNIQASYVYSNYYPSYAFDGEWSDAQHVWSTYRSDSTKQYITCTFEQPVILAGVQIKSGTINQEYVKDFSIYGSNDGVDFSNLIYSGTHGCNADFETFLINTDEAYKHVRFKIDSKYYSHASMHEIIYRGWFN